MEAPWSCSTTKENLYCPSFSHLTFRKQKEFPDCSSSAVDADTIYFHIRGKIQLTADKKTVYCSPTLSECSLTPLQGSFQSSNESMIPRERERERKKKYPESILKKNAEQRICRDRTLEYFYAVINLFTSTALTLFPTSSSNNMIPNL